MSQRIPLYYWGGASNFGDELSPYIVEKLSGKKIYYRKPSSTGRGGMTLFAVGSLLKYDVLHSASIIWGTGTLTSKSLTKEPLKIFPLRKPIQRALQAILNPRAKICAVRGPKTRSLIQKQGFDCPDVYGDPAVLLPKIYTPKPKKKVTVGVIFHIYQNINFITTLKKSGLSVIPIVRDGYREIEDFIDEVTSCDVIFSATLHGLITAQAYGIPAQWIRIPEQPIHDEDQHKFIDYFLGANQDIQTPLEFSNAEEFIDRIRTFEPTPIRPLDLVQERLYQSFPFLD